MFKHYALFSYIIVYLNRVDGLYDETQFPKSDGSWKEVKSWHDKSVKFGQLSAVAVDDNGHVIVFHRGDRVWNGNTFSPNNLYNDKDQGPIMVDTVVELNASTGIVTSTWGSNKFYIPHGLTVDHKGNIWITDVALHQVFKFASSGNHDTLLTLGTRFVPGSDYEHFCKPTSVAVMSSGEFFIADGYCNSRILKYSADGMFIMDWGTNNYKGQMNKHRTHYTLAIPHALTLAEDLQQLCVADRENGRVLCYDCHNGTYMWMFQHPSVGPRLFSVAYSPVRSGRLYIVNGPSPNINVGSFIIDIHNNINSLQRLGDLSNPHDIAVTKDGSQVYVVELEPCLIHKYILVGTNMTWEYTKVANLIVAESTSTSSTGSANGPTEYHVWIIAGSSALGIILILTCAIYTMLRMMGRKKERDISSSWIRPVGVDKVFRLDKLTDRKNIGHGFQRLKTDDESDEDTVAMVNI